jgi:ATP-dependent Clp protease ATP-binding subunit ClpA
MSIMDVTDGTIDFKNAESIKPNGPVIHLKDLESAFSDKGNGPAARQITPVKDADGETVDAWDMISGFSIDMRKRVQEKNLQLDPETRAAQDQALTYFLKKTTGSVKVLAEPGVGKSVFTDSMAARFVAGDVPDSLKGYELLQINASALVSGTTHASALETKVNAMIALSQKHKIIWMVDEAHVLRGAGTHQSNTNDVWEWLKPYLTDGSLKMMALSTHYNWNEAITPDPSLNERFGLVRLEEPKGERLFSIINRWIKIQKLPAVSREVAEEIVHLSNEYNAAGAQPRKGVQLLEHIYARLEFHGHNREITIADTREAAQDMYGIDPADFSHERMLEKINHLRTLLDERIVGQEPAKQALLQMSINVAAGVQDKTKPRGRLLLTGPKGQGKTDIVRTAAEALNIPFVRINMADFKHSSQADTLRSQIAQAIYKNAFSLIFFDEVEKSDEEIQKILLTILDDGEITMRMDDSNGRKGGRAITVRLRNSTMVFAANAGSGYLSSLGKEHVGFQSETDRFSGKDLRIAVEQDGINELLLDRLDEIVPVSYLTKAQFGQVLKMHFERTLHEIQKSTGRSFHIENEAQMLNTMTQQNFQPQMSNREALRLIAKVVRNAAGNAVHQSSSTKSKVQMIFDGNGLRGLVCHDLF